ncbi:hypothetical protein B296_00042473, partial [Ensete ventricosum]
AVLILFFPTWFGTFAITVPHGGVSESNSDAIPASEDGRQSCTREARNRAQRNARGAGGGEGWNSKSAKGSRRWGRKSRREREEAPGWWGETGGGMVAKKRVLVVIDHSARAKHAMMWALTHVANKGDLLTLLHVVPPDPHHHHHHHHRGGGGGEDDVPNLAKSLGTLCKACKPEVGVHSLMVPSLAVFFLLVDLFLLRSSSDEFVEQCISKADCLTLAVRKQRRGVGGYLISTRWQKNFWLLA